MNKIFNLNIFYLSIFTLILFNLFTVYSSTYEDSFNFLIKQSLFYTISIGAILVINHLIFYKSNDYYLHMKKFYFINLVILLFGLILSFSLFILPASVAPEINGAIRWIKTPFFSISPIEILKIGIIFMFTHILTSNVFINNFHSKTLKIFLPFLFIFLILAILVPIKQKDFGNFFLIILVFVSVIFLFFNRIRLIFQLLFIGSLSLITFIAISPHRIQRITNWLNSSNNVGDISSNYQVTQAMTAIYEGGFAGIGFGESVMKLGFIPDLHTDMIFSLLISETGIIGFLTYYLLLLYICAYIVYHSFKLNSLYVLLYSLIISITVIYQSFINLFGVIGLIPMKGITVPFLSYGGSSTLFLVIGFGMSIILLKITSRNTNYYL